MEIRTLRIEDFKCIADIELAFAGTGLVLFGGENDNGKSSAIDALTFAFAGSKAGIEEPIRKGQDRADVSITLDDGTVIRRRAGPKGLSLEIKDARGFQAPSPQATLDRLVGGRFLDPIAFLTAKDQRERLLLALGLKDELEALTERRKTLFAERTGQNRIAEQAKVQLATFDPGAEPPGAERVDVTAINAALRDAAAVSLDGERLRDAAKRAVDAVNRAESDASAKSQSVADIERQIAALTVKLAEANGGVVAAYAEARRLAGVADTATETARLFVEPEIFTLEMELETAAERNAAADKRAAWVAASKRYAQEQERVAELAQCAAMLTEQIAEVDAKKLSLVADAKMPIEGLSVGDNGLLLRGVPLEQASTAVKVRLSLDMAARSNPTLKAIWCKDGPFLDDTSLAAVAQWAEDNGYLVILERVGSRDPGALIFVEGRIDG